MIRFRNEKIPYYEVQYSAPDGIFSRKKKRKRKLQPWQVLLFFYLFMIFFVTVGFTIQYELGLAGAAITELLMLVIAVLFAYFMRTDLREVFPVRKPRILALAGTAVIWFGCITAEVLSNAVLMFLIPETYLQYAESEDSMMSGPVMIISFLVICVLPPICEEAIMRGVIQSGIRSRYPSPWAQALWVGGLFALFHVYPIRYPSIMVLGVGMSYIMAKTNNMVYSSFFHLINNAFAFFVSFVGEGIAGRLPIFSTVPVSRWIVLAASGGEQQAYLISAGQLGLYFVLFGTVFPIILYTGNFLLRLSTEPVRPKFFPKENRASSIRLLVISSAAFFGTGLLLIAAAA